MGFVNMVLAATSSASSVTSPPPRLWPQMVTEVAADTGCGKASPASALTSVGAPGALPVRIEPYMAVKPSSMLPAAA